MKYNQVEMRRCTFSYVKDTKMQYMYCIKRKKSSMQISEKVKTIKNKNMLYLVSV